MASAETNSALKRVFSELVDGASHPNGAFVLNSGDVGLLRSLEALSAAEASQSANDGATIAAHAEHVRYGLSLMNQWAREGGDPFSDANWNEAWKVRAVDKTRWEEIQSGLREEAHQWLEALGTARETTKLELSGMIGSVAHLAYHIGAIRQIDKNARGPKEGAPNASQNRT